MKWIKTAIGAVIAVFSIGIIAISVYKMTQPSEVIKEVSFETDLDEETYYPISIYNELLEYGVIEKDGTITNIVSGYVNNDEIDDITMYASYFETSGTFERIFIEGYINGDILVSYDIGPDGDLFVSGDILDDVTIKLVFAVPQPPQLTGISALLILLIPIVFVGGVLLYFYRPLKKD
ncbi:MAG TPA: hypothetical protein VIK84_06215 [Haloplasmataceae bacterium]